MIEERGEKVVSDDAKAKAAGFLGSLKDALLAAGRDEMPSSPARMAAQSIPITPIAPAAERATEADVKAQAPQQSPSAEEAARLARAAPAPRPPEKISAPGAALERDAIPTTRVVFSLKIRLSAFLSSSVGLGLAHSVRFLKETTPSDARRAIASLWISAMTPSHRRRKPTFATIPTIGRSCSSQTLLRRTSFP